MTITFKRGQLKMMGRFLIIITKINRKDQNFDWSVEIFIWQR